MLYQTVGIVIAASRVVFSFQTAFNNIVTTLRNVLIFAFLHVTLPSWTDRYRRVRWTWETLRHPCNLWKCFSWLQLHLSTRILGQAEPEDCMRTGKVKEEGEDCETWHFPRTRSFVLRIETNLVMPFPCGRFSPSRVDFPLRLRLEHERAADSSVWAHGKSS